VQQNSLPDLDLRVRAGCVSKTCFVFFQEASSVANLGALYHLTGRLDEAEVLYQKALKLVPEDEVTNLNLRRLRNLKMIQEEKKRLRRK